MSTTTKRPLGVTLVAALLLISGALSLVGGIFGLIGASAIPSAEIAGETLDSSALTVLSVGIIVIAVLNLVFAFAILRGSRVARMIVTILQVLTVAGGIGALFTPGAHVWQGIVNLMMPVLIVALLWMGDQTKAFFSKR